MTQKEINKFLANTKVYVDGKSKEIQEKLFSFGYKWSDGRTDVNYTEDPFLFIYRGMYFTRDSNMVSFCNHENREISGEEILSLELTKPSYRPFKDKDECWNEMHKHPDLGWIKNRFKNELIQINRIIEIHCRKYIITIGTDNFYNLTLQDIFKNYTFTDGTPFGIKEN